MHDSDRSTLLEHNSIYAMKTHAHLDFKMEAWKIYFKLRQKKEKGERTNSSMLDTDKTKND